MLIPLAWHWFYYLIHPCGHIIDSIPEVPYKKQQLTGSGAGVNNDTDNLLTPVFSTIEVIPDEKIGQLYAYRINSSAVVLGTRKASEFGASIGIETVADGVYRCVAENANEINDYTINISSIHSK